MGVGWEFGSLASPRSPGGEACVGRRGGAGCTPEQSDCKGVPGLRKSQLGRMTKPTPRLPNSLIPATRECRSFPPCLIACGVTEGASPLWDPPAEGWVGCPDTGQGRGVKSWNVGRRNLSVRPPPPSHFARKASDAQKPQLFWEHDLATKSQLNASLLIPRPNAVPCSAPRP